MSPGGLFVYDARSRLALMTPACLLQYGYNVMLPSLPVTVGATDTGA